MEQNNKRPPSAVMASGYPRVSRERVAVIAQIGAMTKENLQAGSFVQVAKGEESAAESRRDGQKA
jgi:hypothetical protein